MLATRIRAMTGIHWLTLFGVILMAWAVLFAMSIPTELRDGARIFGSDFITSLCTITPDTAGFLRIVLMWALMSAAMMAPTALPAFATYEDLSHTAPEANFAKLVGGYLLIWLGFSVLAAALQMALFRMDLLSAYGDSRSRVLTSVLLLAAGGYQFSPIKEACLSKCRMPMTFFMQHWNEGPLRNGLRLGAVCLGCCWALMLLAFVGGVMNVAFMGLATVIMIFEKLPDLGRFITRPLGGLLIAAGFVSFVTAF